MIHDLLGAVGPRRRIGSGALACLLALAPGRVGPRRTALAGRVRPDREEAESGACRGPLWSRCGPRQPPEQQLRLSARGVRHGRVPSNRVPTGQPSSPRDRPGHRDHLRSRQRRLLLQLHDHAESDQSPRALRVPGVGVRPSVRPAQPPRQRGGARLPGPPAVFRFPEGHPPPAGRDRGLGRGGFAAPEVRGSLRAGLRCAHRCPAGPRQQGGEGARRDRVPDVDRAGEGQAGDAPRPRCAGAARHPAGCCGSSAGRLQRGVADPRGGRGPS